MRPPQRFIEYVTIIISELDYIVEKETKEIGS
jgi:hypothetical protein